MEDGEAVSEENVHEYGFTELYNPEDFRTLSSEEDDSIEADAGFTGDLKPSNCESSLLKGRTFKNMLEFDNAVVEYEAVEGWKFRRVRKNKKIAGGRCRGYEKNNPDSCKVEFRVRFLKKTGKITIRKAYLIHTCDPAIHEFRNGSHKTKCVAEKIRAHVRVNPNTPISHLNETLRNCHQSASKPWSVGRARAISQEEIFGGCKESFQRIPSHVDLLRERDADVHAHYQTGEERRFARLYVAPSSSQMAFTQCRSPLFPVL